MAALPHTVLLKQCSSKKREGLCSGTLFVPGACKALCASPAHASLLSTCLWQSRQVQRRTLWCLLDCCHQSHQDGIAAAECMQRWLTSAEIWLEHMGAKQSCRRDCRFRRRSMSVAAPCAERSHADQLRLHVDEDKSAPAPAQPQTSHPAPRPQLHGDPTPMVCLLHRKFVPVHCAQAQVCLCLHRGAEQNCVTGALAACNTCRQCACFQCSTICSLLAAHHVTFGKPRQLQHRLSQSPSIAHRWWLVAHARVSGHALHRMFTAALRQCCRATTALRAASTSLQMGPTRHSTPGVC